MSEASGIWRVYPIMIMSPMEETALWSPGDTKQPLPQKPEQRVVFISMPNCPLLQRKIIEACPQFLPSLGNLQWVLELPNVHIGVRFIFHDKHPLTRTPLESASLGSVRGWWHLQTSPTKGTLSKVHLPLWELICGERASSEHAGTWAVCPWVKNPSKLWMNGQRGTGCPRMHL